MTKKNVGVTRKKAEKIVEELISRADAINKENNPLIYPHKITKIVLFGSMINSTKDKLGDIDVFVEMIPTWQTEQLLEMNEHFSGLVHTTSWLESLFAAQLYTMKTLKNKSRSLSLQEIYYMKPLQEKCKEEGKLFEYKEVYSFPYENTLV